MTKNGLKRLLASGWLIILMLVVMVQRVAAQPPPLPATFYGTVTLDGADAPEGTPVRALIDGMIVAETQVRRVVGPSVYVLDVPGDDPDTPQGEGGTAGALVQFEIGGVVAEPAGTWQEAASIELNLTATPACYDFNGNGRTDVGDTMVVASHLGTTNPTYDFDGSGTVDVGDLKSIAFCWRKPTASVRRVNAPYFDGDVRPAETAIFWFGQVNTTENYADVRVGYNNDELYLRLAAFDRRLWYDTTPSPDDLTAWDAATLYLNLDGNAGNAPAANAYRFVSQLNWWEADDNWQAAHQGDGAGWVAATVPFTTTTGYRGNAPNDDTDDRGWTVTFRIPFASLGLSGPPPQGTAWGLAVMLHDRDDAVGTSIPDKSWPEAMEPEQPATWGRLSFGMPGYKPPPATPVETVTIRHKLNGATVADVAVGGHTVCGSGLDFWTEWGETNYAGQDQFNIQNQSDVADWPCFSKYYVTFPLDIIPPGKAVISATLTLHQFGNAGQGANPGPQPSFIQVLTVDQDWNEDTLTWNNAPLARENVAAAWMDPVVSFPGWPGVPWESDVSRAVVEAYAAGRPLRLVLYSADAAMHSGKYFVSSDTGDWNAEGRPTLRVLWGGLQ